MGVHDQEDPIAALEPSGWEMTSGRSYSAAEARRRGNAI